jgi:ribosomal protein L11 methyltransferase
VSRAVLRIAFTLPAEAAEAAVDELVPLLPRGVHERDLGGGRTEISFYEQPGALPPRAQLAAAAGTSDWDEREVPDDPLERRRAFGRAWEVAGRLRIRSPLDPAGDGSVPELVIESAAGAFGTGAHPTTRMCLELLLAIPPGGPFADLGTGAGTLAIAAAGLGWEPVFAIDHEPQSVAAARRNAERNGVPVDALELDLTAAEPPPAPTMTANVPPHVHAALAARLPPAVVHLIASGFVEQERDEILAAYAAAGLVPRARLGEHWQAVLLERER